MDIRTLKESVNTPHTQYAALLDTNPVALQQQLSKMKEDIKQLQQTKCSNAYPTPPGNCRSFCTTDGLVICRRCHQVGHFARILHSAASQSPHALSEPSTQLCPSCHLPTFSPIVWSQPPPPNQYSQRPSYRPHTNSHNTMGYPYPQDVVHTNPPRWPTFQSTDPADNRYQARRSNIPTQQNNYNNMIQNHTLLDCQCVVSGSLENIPITILIDTGSS